MQINLKIDDGLYDTYLGKFGSPQHYRKMKEALKIYSVTEPNDRVVLLHGTDRQEIEKIFQTTIDDSKKLIRLIKNMCSYKINGIEMNFTEDQLARIQMQASFHGRTAEVYIKETLEELLARFMEEV